MAASVNDKITDTRNAARPNSTTVSSARSSGATTLSCANLAGWPTASKVHFVTYQIDSSSNPIAGTQLDCYGIVSGNDIGSFAVADPAVDTGNSIGDIVEMLPTAKWGQDLADALTSQHSRTGAHVGINNTGGLTNTGGLSTDTLTVSSGTTLPAGDIGTADLAAGAVTNAKLDTTAGAPGGVWLTWAPTFVNLSGGTLNYAKYTQIGKTIHFRLKYTLAGAGVAGSVTFTTPTSITSDMVASNEFIPGTLALIDTGTSAREGVMRWASSTTISLAADDGTTQLVVLSSTVPHTWANTDVIACSGTYEST